MKIFNINTKNKIYKKLLPKNLKAYQKSIHKIFVLIRVFVAKKFVSIRFKPYFCGFKIKYSKF